MKNQIVVLDTCALMNKNTLLFIEKTDINPFYIFQETVTELKKLQKNGKFLEKLKIASNIIKILKKKNKLVLVSSSATTHADAAILSRIHDGAINKSMLIITDDKSLAKDILKTKTCKSVNYKNVYIKKVDEFGELVDTLSVFGREKAIKESIKVPNKKTLLDTVIPLEGDTITIQRDNKHFSMVLPKEIAQGGEGKIYFYENFAIKIFHKNKLTIEKLNKLKHLFNKNITLYNVASIDGMVFNELNEIVGFTMMKFQGKTLESFLLHEKDIEISKNIAKEVLLTIHNLHKNHIIIGDINPENILISDDHKMVCFIDVDSYQLDSFPCYVFREEFLPPEFSGKNIGTYMRDFSNEYFSVTILIFKILMRGKHPYDQRNSEKSLYERIETSDFKYTINGELLDNTPKGIWNNLWNDLPKEIRKYFFNTFSLNKRYTCEYWRKLIHKF